MQAADLGDTTTMHQTVAAADLEVAELVEREVELHPGEEPKVNVDEIEELVADKGYHSGTVLEQVNELDITTYIPERKQTSKRNWDGKQNEQSAVEENQSRVTGEYSKELLRKRGELVERSFAHCYETGEIRRCTLRGHENILKRLLIHIGAFNICLILRTMLGAGKPRELKTQAATRVVRLLEWLACRYRPDGAAKSRTASIFSLSGTYRFGRVIKLKYGFITQMDADARGQIDSRADPWKHGSSWEPSLRFIYIPSPIRPSDRAMV